MTTVAFDDPASDIRDEIATSSGMPELAEKIWFHKTAAAVIDAERCVGCGGCIAACPSRSISVGEDGKPTLVKMCTGCSACWDYCPLAGLRAERLGSMLDGGATHPASDPGSNGAGEAGQPLPDPGSNGAGNSGDALCDTEGVGLVRGAYSVRAAAGPNGAQDGGVVTSLLAHLIESGHVDGAIVTRKIDAFHGEPFLATSVDELRGAAGSVYHQSHPLAVLNQPLPAGIRRIAFVGTPCQVSVLRALQRYPWRYRSTAAHAVTLAIALFCTRSFDPDNLQKAVANAGVDTSKVQRIDVRDGVLSARGAGGGELLAAPVREFHHASLKGCDECADFTGLVADLSVGNLASEPGHSTLLVRTDAGAEALTHAAPALDIEPLADLGAVSRTAQRDWTRAERSSARGLDPNGPLWISYGEHLAAYRGTRRAPAAPPSHRSHHYEVSC